MISDYINILHLIIIWFLGWGIYFTLEKKWLYLKNKPELTAVYFLTLAVAIFYNFRSLLPSRDVPALYFYPIIILGVFYTVNHFYFILRKNFNEPILLIERHPLDTWLEANRRSLLTTSGAILFQQSIITLIIFNLSSLGFDLKSIILIFAATFGAMHLPLIFVKGIYLTSIFTTAAVLSAILFPVFLLNLMSGMFLNYIIHWMFYVSITFIFWKYQDSIKE